MAGQLKVSAYALSITGKGLNLDNMYMNGRYVNAGSDSDSKMTRSVTNDFQVYGVSDSEIGVGDDRSVGTENGNIVMDMLQRTENSLNQAQKINKDSIWQAIVDANNQAKERRNKLGKDVLGTSFAALFLHGNRGLAVHLGDSRIYVIRGGRMLQITDDHLESSDMFKLGILTQAQSEVHKEDSRLTAYIGMDDVYDAHDEAFSKYFIFYPGDMFLICTDGLSDAIDNEEMERVARLLKDAAPDQLANMLMKTASEKSKEDMTLMVLSIDDAPGEAPKRGNGTIPRKENYERQQSVSAQGPQAPRVSRAVEDSEGGRPQPKVRPQAQPVRKAPQAAQEQPDQNGPAPAPKAQPYDQPAPDDADSRRMQAIDEMHAADDDGFDDGAGEGSMLDNILHDPKKLAIAIGAAVIVIILLIVIISAASKGRKSKNTTPVQEISEVSTIESSTVTVLPQVSVPEQSESSAVEQIESSTVEESETVGTYTVQDGDSLYNIVLNTYGTADMDLINSFCDYNGITIDTMLYPGDELKTPSLETLTGSTGEESSSEESSAESSTSD